MTNNQLPLFRWSPHWPAASKILKYIAGYVIPTQKYELYLQLNDKFDVFSQIGQEDIIGSGVPVTKCRHRRAASSACWW